jgi:hypothetical protein
MTLLKTNYQDTHLNYDPAYIKKLGHCFSAIMGVSVNTFMGVSVNTFMGVSVNTSVNTIKKLGHCFSVVMGVSVNTVSVNTDHGCLCKYHLGKPLIFLF